MILISESVEEKRFDKGTPPLTQILQCKYSYACKRCAYSYVDEDGQTRSSDTLRRCQSRIIAMTVNRGYIRRQVGRTHYIM